MSAMPAHIVSHLIATGRVELDGATRRARVTSCRSCNAVVLAGLDHDKSAILVRVDPLPLAPAGELGALLTNRTTYRLTRGGEGYRIDWRSSLHIRSKPAGSLTNADVVAEHKCSAILPANCYMESRIPNRAINKELDAICPF